MSRFRVNRRVIIRGRALSPQDGRRSLFAIALATFHGTEYVEQLWNNVNGGVVKDSTKKGTRDGKEKKEIKKERKKERS